MKLLLAAILVLATTSAWAVPSKGRHHYVQAKLVKLINTQDNWNVSY